MTLELDVIVERRGYPCMVVSDNGTELTSNAMLAWQQDRGVEAHRNEPQRKRRPPMNNYIRGAGQFILEPWPTQVCFGNEAWDRRPLDAENWVVVAKTFGVTWLIDPVNLIQDVAIVLERHEPVRAA